MYPYQIQICQKLKHGDYQRQVAFSESFLCMDLDDSFLSSKLVMSDEAYSYLNKGVNRQKTQLFGLENPSKVIEATLHSEKVTLWCGMIANETIAP